MADLKKLNSALNVMRRMPPSKIKFNLAGLLNLMPETTEELLQRVDQPLDTAKDKSGKLYLRCDYNRDGDSYRSPWNNAYEPPLSDGFMPSSRLREIEEKTNLVFDSYRALYYEGGISSVYLWDLDSGDNSFAACFLIKKEILEPQRRVSQGNWDSIHVVQVIPLAGQKKATYSVTSTVMLSMMTDKGKAGTVLLSGSFTRKSKDKSLAVNTDDDHVINMGSLIEDIEISIRGEIEGVYIQKTREVINYIRKPAGASSMNAGARSQTAMIGELGIRLKGSSVAGRGVALPGMGKN
jgi:capping protein beta